MILSLWVLSVAVVLAEPGPPNVLLFLADDLGYSDLGCYGSEIETPNLDKLAADGLKFTQFYNTARCWPTRAAVLTGYYAQQVRRDTVPGISKGGQGKRPPWAPLLPAMLKPLGYRSFHSGKWHVDGMPVASGFDRSYYLQDTGRFFSPRVHFLNDEKLPSTPRDAGYYSTIAIADYAIEQLKEHADKYSDQPFFQFVAFTAPHFPLHALPEDIERYRDKYQRGWDELRVARFARQQSMGLLTTKLSEVETDVGPPYHFPDALEKLGAGEVNRPLPWADLTEVERDFQSTKMAIHAAMIDRMDREIGRVLDQVRAMGAWDNTLVMFLSDNGASAEIMVRDDGHDPNAPPGSAATHLTLGPGWSTCSNTPFRRHKTWVHEGGISTPFVVHWPLGIKERGGVRHQPAHVIDLVPTILEVAGSAPPKAWEGVPVPTAPGRSLVRVLNDSTAPAEHEDIWWLHEGNRALRMGDWKIVAADGEAWELFHMTGDRGETTDRALENPEKLVELSDRWDELTAEFFNLARQDVPESVP